jgi:hypothetical protein
MKIIRGMVLVTLSSFALASIAFSGTVSVPIAANVVKTCVYVGGSGDGLNINLNNDAYPGINLGTYKATLPLSTTRTVFTIKCSAGALLSITQVTPFSWSLNPVSFVSPNLPVTLSTATTTFSFPPDGSIITNRNVKFDISAGYFGVKSGNYSNTLTFTVTFS